MLLRSLIFFFTVLLICSCMAAVSSDTVPDKDTSSLKEVPLDAGAQWTLYLEQTDHEAYRSDLETALIQAKDITRELIQLPEPETLELALLCTDTFQESLPVRPWIDALHHEGRIFLRVPCHRPLARETLAPRVRHEYVHAALYHAGTTDIPLWLNEGLAFSIEFNQDAQGEVDLLKFLKRHTAPHVQWLQKEPDTSESLLSPLAWNTLAQCAVRYLLEFHPELIQQYLDENRPDTIFPAQHMEPMVQACTGWILTP